MTSHRSPHESQQQQRDGNRVTASGTAVIALRETRSSTLLFAAAKQTLEERDHHYQLPKGSIQLYPSRHTWKRMLTKAAHTGSNTLTLTHTVRHVHPHSL